MAAVAEIRGVASPPSLIHAIESHLAACYGTALSSDPLLAELPEFNALFPRPWDGAVVIRPAPTTEAVMPRWWWVTAGVRANGAAPRPGELGYTLHHRRRGLAVSTRTANQRTLMPRGALVQVVKTPEDRRWVVDLWARCGPPAVASAASDLSEWLAVSTARDPEPYRILLVWSGGRPVATVATRRSEDVVGVFGLSVLPELRHAGLGRAILAATLRRSECEGARWAVTVARIEEEPFFLDFGFSTYCDFDIYRSAAPMTAFPTAPV